MDGLLDNVDTIETRVIRDEGLYGRSKPQYSFNLLNKE